MIRKFTNDYNPVIRLDYEGNLDDSSGNGLHLSGTPVFRKVFENTTGLVSGVLNRGGISDLALRDLDDKTIQVILIMRAAPANAYVCSFAASGETEATNYAWGLRLTNQDGVYYFAETGAGVDVSYSVSTPLPAFGVPFLLALRIKAGVAQFFLNGLPVGAPSAVLTNPTGATASQLLINGSGTSFPEQLGFKFNTQALTDAQLREEYNTTLGWEFGMLDNSVQSMWVGGVTTTSAVVVAKLAYAADQVRLVATGPNDVHYSSYVATTDNVAKLEVTGLDPDSEYTYEVEADGVEMGELGYFRTMPSGASSFTVCFSGDASTGSNHESFAEIETQDPSLFIHLGDAHYENISTNSPALFNAAFDAMLVAPNQGSLYRNTACAVAWDDHCYGGNNSDSTSASKPAAAAVYRARVPHYPLPDSIGIWQTWDIGRVRFVLTDQRSYASPNSATDNSSKTLLGSAQKTWFKNLISNSPGKLIVWICPRMFGGVATAGADHWGGFTTERTELVNHINANAAGRVVVLSADAHCLAIDDGTNHFGLPTFQAAPLDRTPDTVVYGGATYSEGWYNNNGQYGVMDVEDLGGSTLEVDWYGYDSNGVQLVLHSFTVTL